MNKEYSITYLRETTKDELIDLILSMQDQLKKIRQENENLKKLLGESQRSGKRQAAPFSKNNKKKNPRKPGRKSGKDLPS